MKEMDRLTNIGINEEIWISDTDETRKLGQRQAAYRKLKEYEDTGLTPEEIRLMIDAERNHWEQMNQLLRRWKDEDRGCN